MLVCEGDEEGKLARRGIGWRNPWTASFDPTSHSTSSLSLGGRPDASSTSQSSCRAIMWRPCAAMAWWCRRLRGSTAYALSAGGPLVAPGYRGLVVVPLAPHTLRSRAIVTEQHDVVEIVLAGEASRCEAALFADGEALAFDRPCCTRDCAQGRSTHYASTLSTGKFLRPGIAGVLLGKTALGAATGTRSPAPVREVRRVRKTPAVPIEGQRRAHRPVRMGR